MFYMYIVYTYNSSCIKRNKRIYCFDLALKETLILDYSLFIASGKIQIFAISYLLIYVGRKLSLAK